MSVWARRGSGESADPQDGRRGTEPPRLRMVGAEVYPDWEAIYRDNVGWVYRMLFAKVGSRPDAEDLTAEVFLAALRPLQVSASVREVRSYLVATARTVLADHWRRTLGRELTTLDEDLAELLPEEGGGSLDRLAEAERILAELPENYRAVLRLRYLLGHSLKDAAGVMGVTVGNVKVLQHRALKAAAKVAERNGV
ncbi:MAG TPA: RNA polymerase sigma factor [Pseudonocardiaceae bacterium]|nr:RNA polymerase sigma factor [Pseudonocardiaceae bacterium]